MAEIISEGSIGSSELPHSETKLLHKYTPFDYGPLATLPDAATVIGSFRGGSYYLTEVQKEEGIVLYRLHDDKHASACGRYWTLENRGGVLGDRIDLAVPTKWNVFTKTTSLVVPKGVLLYEGPVGPQPGGPVGGGWQIFIPGEVLKPLSMAMDLNQNREVSENKEKIEQYVQEARLNQKDFFENYGREMNQMNQQIIDDFCDSVNPHTFLTAGNNLPKLDTQVGKALANLTDPASAGNEEISVVDVLGSSTSILLHSDEIRLADGSIKNISLYVHVDFSKNTAQPNIMFDWK